MLAQHKNLTCNIEDTEIAVYFLITKRVKKEVDLKIVHEVLNYWLNTLIAKADSPFIFHFNEAI